MSDLVLRLPLPPNHMNPRRAGRTWTVAWGVKKRYVEQAVESIRVQARGRRFHHADVWFAFTLPGRFDDDNITGLCKAPLDALRKAGVLENDKRPFCAIMGIPEQTVVGTVRRRKREAAGDYVRRKQLIEAQWGIAITIRERVAPEAASA